MRIYIQIRNIYKFETRKKQSDGGWQMRLITTYYVGGVAHLLRMVVLLIVE